MKIRNRNAAGDKIVSQMTRMIDVVFQLLIFFMLTLKIIEPEGDFSINMPLGQPAEAAVSDAELQPLRVRLEANPETGELTQLVFNDQILEGPEPFKQLNREIGRIVNDLKGIGPADEEDAFQAQEVEIDPAFELDHRYLISAISACSGTMHEGTLIPYISRIKFAQIRKEQ